MATMVNVCVGGGGGGGSSSNTNSYNNEYQNAKNSIENHALNEQMRMAQKYIDQNNFIAKLPAVTGNVLLLLLED